MYKRQTVHFFDRARWIAGADPVEVFAAGSALADPRLALPEYDDVDTSVCVLKMPDGALVQIDNNRRTGYGYDERIEVCLLYTSPSPRDRTRSRMPSSA